MGDMLTALDSINYNDVYHRRRQLFIVPIDFLAFGRDAACQYVILSMLKSNRNI